MGEARSPGRSLAVPVAVGAVVVLGAGLRMWGLGHQGLWYDEAVTAWLLQSSPGRTLAALARTESTPPLYYLLAWGWVRLTGLDEAGLRSLSALAGTLTVPVAYAAARLLAGRGAALLAALLVAVNPLLVWYAQEGRSYALFALTSAVALWLFARARRAPSSGRLLAWGAAGALSLCVHYFAALPLLVQGALVLAERRVPLRRRVLAVALPAATAGALVDLAHRQSARVYRFAQLPLARRVADLPRHLLLGYSPPRLGAWAPAAALAVAAVAAVLVAVRGSSRERRGALVAGAVAAVTLTVPVLAALAGHDYLNSRNVLAAVVPLAIVLAAGLAARRAWVVGLPAAAALVVASVLAVAGVHRDALAQRPPWRAVAAALAHPPAVAGAGAGGRGSGRGALARSLPRAVYVRGSGTWARSLAFYLGGRAWWAPPRGVVTREIDVLRRIPGRGDCPRTTWWGATCDVGTRPPLAGPPARGFRLVAASRVAGFEVTRFLARRPIRIHSAPPLEGARGPGTGRHRAVLVLGRREPPAR